MTKLKALIIDDDWHTRRSNLYNKTLSTAFEIFSLSNVDNDNVFDLINKFEADVYIIDIVLVHLISIKTGKPLHINEVLQAIPKSKPIELVSNEYSTLVSKQEFTHLMKGVLDNHRNVIGFIDWKEFEFLERAEISLSIVETIANRIELDILRFKKNITNTSYDTALIGVVAALEVELTPFLSNFAPTDLRIESVANLVIYKGTIKTRNNHEVQFAAVRQDKMGMVDAAFATSILINAFKVKHIFHIGVCGGENSKEINYGDLIIPNESVAYQGGKLTENGLIPEMQIAGTNSGLAQYLNKQYTTNILSELYNAFLETCDRSSSVYKKVKKLKLPEVNYNEMACGDLIISKPDEIKRIKDEIAKKRKLCSVDMESYSILRANKLFSDVKTIVLKAIMDKTTKKTDTYKEYAAYISGNFLYRILYDEIYNFSS